MAAHPITRKYPLDLSGQHPNNLVIAEPHTLDGDGQRALTPLYGVFYSASLVVRDADSGKTLAPYEQYKALQLYPDITSKTGQEVTGLILITDDQVSDNIEIDYQVVGGEYAFTAFGLQELLKTAEIDGRTIVWGDVVGKPNAYAPAPHLHNAGDVYGFEYLVESVEKLRQAVLASTGGSTLELRQYIEMVHDEMRQEVKDFQSQIDEHEASVTQSLDELIKRIDDHEAFVLKKLNGYETQLDDFDKRLTDGLADIRTEVNDLGEQFQTSYDAATADIQRQIDEHEQYISQELAKIRSDIQAFKDQVNASITAFDKRLTAAETRIEDAIDEFRRDLDALEQYIQDEVWRRDNAGGTDYPWASQYLELANEEWDEVPQTPVGGILTYDASSGLALIYGTDGSGIDKGIAAIFDVRNTIQGHGIQITGGRGGDSQPKIEIVDGDGSGLDADLLDGQQGSFYQDASNLNAGLIPDARLGGYRNVGGQWKFGDQISISHRAPDAENAAWRVDDFGVIFTHLENGIGDGDNRYNWNFVNRIVNDQADPPVDITEKTLYFDRLGTFEFQGHSVWHAGNDGAGSGLDADLLDGYDAEYFVPHNRTGNFPKDIDTYSVPLLNTTNSDFRQPTVPITEYPMGISVLGQEYSGSEFPTRTVNILTVRSNRLDWSFQLIQGGDTAPGKFWLRGNSGTEWTDLFDVWHSGYQGSGTGMDADLLDGQEGSFYQDASNLNWGRLPSARLTGVYDSVDSIGWGKVGGAQGGHIGFYSDDGSERNNDVWIIGGENIGSTSTRSGNIVFGVESGGSRIDTAGKVDWSNNGTLDWERDFKVAGTSTFNGPVVFDNGTNTTVTIKSNDNGESVLNLIGDTQGTGRLFVGQHQSLGGGILYDGDGSPNVIEDGGTNDHLVLYRGASAPYVWTARNHYQSNAWEFRENPTVLNKGRVLTIADEGSGNGLDADLLDGQHGVAFKQAISSEYLGSDDDLNNLADGWYGWSRNGSPANSFGSYMGLLQTTNINTQQISVRDSILAFRGTDNKNWGPWNVVWHQNNDGVGSGLDADLLDGLQGEDYATKADTNVFQQHQVIANQNSSEPYYYASYPIDNSEAATQDNLSSLNQIIKLNNNTHALLRGRISASLNLLSSYTNSNILDVVFGWASGVKSLGGSLVTGSTDTEARFVTFTYNDETCHGIQVTTRSNYKLPSKWFFDGYASDVEALTLLLESEVTDITEWTDDETKRFQSGTTVIAGSITANGDQNYFRRGINGGYSDTSDGGNKWGTPIWGMGDAYNGTGYGSGFKLNGNQYGLVWLRESHGSAEYFTKEGLYLYRSGTNIAAFGHAGAKINAPLQIQGNEAWHAGNDGAGSGLDADLLDGIQGNQFLRNDTDGELTGTLTINSGGLVITDADTQTNKDGVTASLVNKSGRSFLGSEVYASYRNWDQSHVPFGYGFRGYMSGAGVDGIGVKFFVNGNSDDDVWLTVPHLQVADFTKTPTVSGATIWHAGNQGPGSGMDADTVDGIQGSQFLRSDIDQSFTGKTLTFRQNGGGVSFDTGGNDFAGVRFNNPDGNSGELEFWTSDDGQEPLVFRQYPDKNSNKGTGDSRVMFLSDSSGFDVQTGVLKEAGERVWSPRNQGPGTGMDADTVDGLQGDQFLRSDTADVATGSIEFQNGIHFGKQAVSDATDLSKHIALYNDTYGFSITDYTLNLVANNGSDDVNVVGTLKEKGARVWSPRNQGSGSGLDADLLDGYHAQSSLTDTSDALMRVGAFGLGATGLNQLRIGSIDFNSVTAGGLTYHLNDSENKPPTGWQGGYLFTLPSRVQIAYEYRGRDVWIRQNPGSDYAGNSWAKFWNSSVQGPGTGMDADLLDGQQGSFYQDASNLNAGRLRSARLTGDYSFTNLVLSDSLSVSGASTFNGPVTINQGDNTTVTIKSNDNGESVLNLIGDNQGTGRVFVGQSMSHGGGIEYNGDGTPASASPNEDLVTFYRRSSGTDVWTAYYPYSNSQWTFATTPRVNGVGTILTTADEGSGNGIDADLLDGQHGDYYRAGIDVDDVRNIDDSTDTPDNIPDKQVSFDFKTSGNVNWNGPNAGTGYVYILNVKGWGDSSGGQPSQLLFARDRLAIRGAQNDDTWNSWYTFWHTGNDGTGSGLDADMVDGLHWQDIKKYTDDRIGGIDSQETVKHYIDQKHRVLTDFNINITVSGTEKGDYETIGDAIKFLTDWRRSYNGGSFPFANITLKAGFKMNETVMANQYDLSWITIEGEDETTSVNADAMGRAVTDYDNNTHFNQPLFGAFNCGGVTLNQLFVIDGGQSTSGYGDHFGYLVEGAGAFAHVMPGAGVRNANTAGLLARKGGVIYADEAITSHKGETWGGYPNGAVAAVEDGIVFFESGKTVVFDFYPDDETVTTGISESNVVPRGLHTRDGGKIYAANATIADTEYWQVEASSGSYVDVTGATFGNNKNNAYVITVDTGAKVVARNTTFATPDRGTVSVETGGRVDLTGSNLTNIAGIKLNQISKDGSLILTGDLLIDDQFLRRDVSDTFSGQTLTFDQPNAGIEFSSATDSGGIRFNVLSSSSPGNTQLEIFTTDDNNEPILITTSGNERARFHRDNIELTSSITNFTTEHNRMRRGINGGYDDTSGSGEDWASSIWGIGNSWDGSNYGVDWAPGNMYGLAWVRDQHSEADSAIGDGIYIYRASNRVAGFGEDGSKFYRPVTMTGSLEVGSHTIFKDKIFVDRQMNSSAAISLAVGDDDTGFNWVEDGIFDLYANNDSVARVSKGGAFDVIGGTLKEAGQRVWSPRNQGSGTGMDADTVDGIQGNQFLRNDTDGTLTGTLTINSGGLIIGDANTQTNRDGVTASFVNKSGRSFLGSEVYASYRNWDTTYADFGYGFRGYIAGGGVNRIGVKFFVNGNGDDDVWLTVPSGQTADFTKTPTVSGATIWHAGNDGTGSGLDADLLDGIQSSQFLRNDLPDQTIKANLRIQGTGTGDSNVSYVEFIDSSGNRTGYVGDGSANNGTLTIESVNGRVQIRDTSGNGAVWHEGNQGSGSGLDADLLDGIHGNQLLRRDVSDTFSGQTLTFDQPNAEIRFANSTDAGGMRFNMPSSNSGVLEIYTEDDNDEPILITTSGNERARFHPNNIEFTSSLTNFTTDHNRMRRGINGGYDSTSGSGDDWGATIWSIGDDWDGTGYGSDFTIGSGQYGLAWLRNEHGNVDSFVKEGLYLYRGGTNIAAFGDSGSKINTPLEIANHTTFKDKIFVDRQMNSSAKISLAVGDDDTGLNWVQDGTFDIYANNDSVARISNGGIFDVIGGTLKEAGERVWSPRNQGSGSGMDADLLDGKQGSEYAPYGGTNDYFHVQTGTSGADAVNIDYLNDQLGSPDSQGGIFRTIMDSTYPVDSVVWSTSSTNPSEKFNMSWSTWERYANGRTLVSEGNSDYDYNADTEGGQSTVTLTTDQMPQHRHEFNSSNTSSNSTYPQVLRNDTSGNADNTTYTSYEGGGQSHENRMPYKVAYAWVRTA